MSVKIQGYSEHIDFRSYKDKSQGIFHSPFHCVRLGRKGEVPARSQASPARNALSCMAGAAGVRGGRGGGLSLI
ncbi:MAG: hypothetical protein WC650_03460 [Candidatus Doudnabacteria bacterium]